MTEEGGKVWVGLPCLLLGGTEVATLGMVRALVEDGWAVSVCCYHESDAHMVERYRQAGVRVDLLEHVRGDFWGLFRRLVRLFRDEKPDVAHIQYMAPGLLPILAAKWAGVPRIIATVHAAGRNGYGWKAKAMLRFASLLTNHFFCVSHNSERFWFGRASGAENGGERRKVKHSTIYCGIDAEAIQAAGHALDRAKERAALGIATGAPVVGIAGRVVRLKGHDVLFHAVARLTATHPDLRVLVVGEGPDRPFFEQVARDVGMADRVVWVGRVEPERLPIYFYLMDVLAMPSQWEGFGLTAAEAMAAGVPVVGSDVPGLREVLDDGRAGTLFPVGNVDLARQALGTLLGDRAMARRLGEVGRRLVEERFALSLVTVQWQGAYDAFLGKRGPGRV